MKRRNAYIWIMVITGTLALVLIGTLYNIAFAKDYGRGNKIGPYHMT